MGDGDTSLDLLGSCSLDDVVLTLRQRPATDGDEPVVTTTTVPATVRVVENDEAKVLSLSVGSGTEVNIQDFKPGSLLGESVVATGVIVSNRTAAPGPAPLEAGSSTLPVGKTLTP